MLAAGPELRMTGAAAQTRMVSVARIRLVSRKSPRLFKGIICDDISEFESHMPSHAVGLCRCGPCLPTSIGRAPISRFQEADQRKRPGPWSAQGRSAIANSWHGRMTTGVPLSLTQNLKHNHVLHERGRINIWIVLIVLIALFADAKGRGVGK